jgi:DNA repair protein RecN (Recombination protein N)
MEIVMLSILRIKNLALVEDVTLELSPGFNAITGETGAGKSILIGALSLALGERADRGLIRSGADACTVEATFDLRGARIPAESFLQENGLEPCEGGMLIVKRTLSNSGGNRQFVNGSPTTLNVLATLGNWLVDIHGPYDHQSLLRPGAQLDLLDGFARCQPVRRAFADMSRRLAGLAESRRELVIDDAAYNRRLELLRHQIAEINAARLRPDEEPELQEAFQRASNAARILELAQETRQLLSGDGPSLSELLGTLGRALTDLHRMDPGIEPLRALHAQAAEILDEVRVGLDRHVDRVFVDPVRLQQLEERINLIQSMKRKYGPTLAYVLVFGRKAAGDLEMLESRASRLAEIDLERGRLNSELQRLGATLTASRRRAIPDLQREIASQLAELGFKRSHFEVALETSPAREDSAAASSGSLAGFDQIEFLFAPNPGEPPRPLRAIASSGEMARVMLALKTVLAAQDAVPVLVFDEVDANIGGETAQTVGLKMRELGRHHQVFCVTHLAPVAACAPHHWVVNKQLEQDRTTTSIAAVHAEERIRELARMLGGSGPAAIGHARALLEAQPAPRRKSRGKAVGAGG